MTATSATVTTGPAYLPVELYKGDSYASAVFTIKIGGVVQDISSDSFKLRIRVRRTETALLTLEIASGITSPGTGQIYWFLTPAQTNALATNKELEYDLQWTRDSDGQVKTLVAGVIRVTKDITPA